MDVTSAIPSATKTKSTDIVSNPDSELTSDDFMKLFLTELQYQDPTAPMETKDMLEQTSQLTQLQTNDELKKSLNQLTAQLNSSTQFNSIAMIGKLANTGQDGFNVSDAKNLTSDIPFDLYFDNDFVSATVKIKNANGEVVRIFNLDEGDKGIKSFTWDGKDDNGNPVPDGVYAVTADFKNKDLEEETTKMGVYPISSVKFEDGKAYAKLGNKYIKVSDIKEVME
jgi:flagellar basal-body rod modification protein FlgD